MARHLGVRYVDSGAGGMSSGNRAGKLMANDLSGVRDELKTELRAALITLDARLISEVIERISREHQALGSILAGYANSYSYTKILQAIEIDESHSTAPSNKG
jgi:hypothetical protein